MLKLLSVVAVFGVILPALLLAQGGYYPPSHRRIAPGTSNPSAYNVAGSFRGKLKELTNKEIMIETDDNQLVSIHRSRKTKFLKGDQTIKASDIDIETPVAVDAIEEVDLSLTARSVTVDTPKKSAENK